MKTIIAFIRPSKEEAVRDILHGAPGVTGATFMDVRGFGRGRGHDHSKGPCEEAIVGTMPKVRVEIMVPNEHADTVAKIVALAARTGNRGDGKVYVAPLHAAERISTGESGIGAV